VGLSLYSITEQTRPMPRSIAFWKSVLALSDAAFPVAASAPSRRHRWWASWSGFEAPGRRSRSQPSAEAEVETGTMGPAGRATVGVGSAIRRFSVVSVSMSRVQRRRRAEQRRCSADRKTEDMISSCWMRTRCMSNR